jgi:hypothetical protein
VSGSTIGRVLGSSRDHQVARLTHSRRFAADTTGVAANTIAADTVANSCAAAMVPWPP